MATSGEFERPWVEKYRPLKLSDIVGNSEAVDRLRAISVVGNVPNIILSGPPGIGKTTSVLCLAREMLGDKYTDAVLELNASDARGIDVVRNKIKQFAQKKVTLPRGRHKIIILDEADSMTAAAQQAMRRTMEIYSSTTRFALACNNSTKIIEPIQSRCAVLRYSKLNDSEILARVQEVCKLEKVSHEQSGIESIVFIAEGDMRNALNSLQSTVSGFGHVSSDNVFKVCDQPHPLKVQQMLLYATKGQAREAFDIVMSLHHAGYAATDIVQTMFKLVRTTDEQSFPEPMKMEYFREIGFTHQRLSEGLDSRLQLLGCVARVVKVAEKFNKMMQASSDPGGRLMHQGAF